MITASSPAWLICFYYLLEALGCGAMMIVTVLAMGFILFGEDIFKLAFYPINQLFRYWRWTKHWEAIQQINLNSSIAPGQKRAMLDQLENQFHRVEQQHFPETRAELQQPQEEEE